MLASLESLVERDCLFRQNLARVSRLQVARSYGVLEIG